MYEVFNPRNGRPLATVPTRLLAKLVCWIWGRGYDYERRGQGWA